MCCLLNKIPTNPKCFSLNCKPIKKGSGRCRTQPGPAQTRATLSASPGQSASPSPIPTSSWRSKLLHLCPELQCSPFKGRTRTESSRIPAARDTNWRDPFSHRGCDTSITRSQRASKDLLEVAEATLACPEPMWVANRRGTGRGDHTGATLFPEVSCSPTQKPWHHDKGKLD